MRKINRISSTWQRACVESMINYSQSGISQDRLDYAVVTNNSKRWLRITTLIPCPALAGALLCIILTKDRGWQHSHSWTLWEALAKGIEISRRPEFQPRSHTILLFTTHWLEPPTRYVLTPVSLASGARNVCWNETNDYFKGKNFKAHFKFLVLCLIFFLELASIRKEKCQ